MFSDIFEDKPREIRPKRRIEDPREFLTAVMNEDPAVMNSDYLSQRMRAAIELLPYTYPKLAVVAQVSENDIATLLDRRIKRYEEMNNGNLIEQRTIEQPQTIDHPIESPKIETSRPLSRTSDRRYRRL